MHLFHLHFYHLFLCACMEKYDSEEYSDNKILDVKEPKLMGYCPDGRLWSLVREDESIYKTKVNSKQV